MTGALMMLSLKPMDATCVHLIPGWLCLFDI